jgi:CRISPR-associated protein Csb2
VTVYRPSRHAKRLSPTEALEADILREIGRRGSPQPQVEVLSVEAGPRGGLAGRVRLEFHGAEAGPVILGRTRHVGGGLFSAAD